MRFGSSGISKKYSALHLGNYTDEELSKANSESERIKGMKKSDTASVYLNGATV